MRLTYIVYDLCPTCGSTIRRAAIDRHPTDRHAAIRSLKCTDCGYEKNTVLSLRPAVPPPPKLTA